MQSQMVGADGGTLLKELSIVRGNGFAPVTNGYIAIKGDKIVSVGSMDEDLSQFKEFVQSSMKGYVACPGFVNCHTHASMSFFRGLGHDRELPKRPGYSVIEDFFFPAERALTPELIEPLSYSYLVDGLKSGVTSFNDAYFFSGGVCKAIERLGLKGAVAEHMGDLDGAVIAGREQWLQQKKRIENWPFPSIQPVVYAHAADTVSKDFLKELTQFAKANDLPFHMHLSQTKGERERVIKRERMSPVKYAKECGALHDKSLLVHLLSVDDEDIHLLSDSGAIAALCPVSEILYESAPPAAKLFNAGIPIALGTDCAASSDGADILQEARFFSLLLRMQGIDFPDQNPSMILDCLTKVPAQWMSAGRSGSLESGKEADIVFFEKDICSEPMSDMAVNLLYSMSSKQVRHVMVNGRWALKDRELVHVSESCLYDDYRQALVEIKKRTDLPIGV